jgi:hypothetical protein
MSASRVITAAHCLMPDFEVLQSDCVRAYVQSKFLGGNKTVVFVPRRWWPKGWMSYTNPVCELLLFLYGHPKSGD